MFVTGSTLDFVVSLPLEGLKMRSTPTNKHRRVRQIVVDYREKQTLFQMKPSKLMAINTVG